MLVRRIVLLMLFSLSFLVPMAAPGADKPAFPDDPTLQTDVHWVDDRWQKTEVGQFLGATIETPRKRTPKAIAIKVGAGNEATVCFDTDLLRYSAGWMGGFLQMHPQRYGLIAAPTPAGEIQFTSASEPGWAQDGSFSDPRQSRLGPLPRDWAKYHGLYLSGNRVVLSYSVGEASILESPWFERGNGLDVLSRQIEITDANLPLLTRILDQPGSKATLDSDPSVAILEDGNDLVLVRVNGTGGRLIPEGSAVHLQITPREGAASLELLICRTQREHLPQFVALEARKSPPLKSLMRGGAPHWKPLVTEGVLDRSSAALAIDTITIPYENPWNALVFAAGHDFFSNGDAAVAMIHGDVWRVSGLDETLRKVTWKRFATGLYQPLGLKIIEDKVYVLERDQITILHDQNGDGEADFYENFNNDCISAGGGHSYATCLETDSQGNFYFLKCSEGTPHGGTVLKVSAHGSTLTVVATGFRNPNGLGIGPGDYITAADQQGDWVPETRLDVIRPGGFYGFMPMHKRASPPADYEPPLCWIPRQLDNSAGGQVWIPEGNWGVLGGQMLHLSYGRCTMMAILRDKFTGAQGGIVPLPGRFLSGVCRGRFNPADGHLYLSGLRGWQTAAVRDGAFQRVRYTKDLLLPMGFGFRSNQLELTFSAELDKELAEDLESYSAEQWNYRWTSRYGSPDYSLADPEKEGRDPVEIETATLKSDGKTVVLRIPNLTPVMQFALKYNLETTEGEPITSEFYATINQLK